MAKKSDLVQFMESPNPDNKSLNIYQRMIRVQKSVSTVLKNETVKMNETDKGYKAVTHDDVAAALHLPLAEAGVFMLPDIVEYQNTEFEKKNKWDKVQSWYRTDLKIKVRWINVDDPSDFFESTGASFALDTSDKSFAKAYSLALKIVLLKVHLLESRDGEEQRPFDDANIPEGKDSSPKQKNQAGKAKSDLPTPKDGPIPNDSIKNIAPKDYVVPLGDANTKGKKLSEISRDVLEKLLKWSLKESQVKPPPKNIKQLTEVNLYVSLYLKSLPPPPPTPNQIADAFPNEMPDPVPMPENEPQHTENDLWDYIIPIPVNIEGVNGTPLAMIPEADLRASIEDIKKQMLVTPRPPGLGNMLEVIATISKFLNSLKKES